MADGGWKGEKTRGVGGGRGKQKKKTDDNSGHYVIASSRPPERQTLERRTLAPKASFNHNTAGRNEKIYKGVCFTTTSDEKGKFI